MNILVASSNPHKIEEIQAVFARLAKSSSPTIKLLSLRDIGLDITEPEEDQPTFAGNAKLKAAYYAKHANLHCLADDSGLEVDALAGAPGVHSARYAGVTGPRSEIDQANNLKLMQALADLPTEKRTARFVCAMSLCVPAGEELAAVRGTFEGRILGPGDEGFVPGDHQANARGRGSNGFGYDPLFFVPERGCTSAQLSPAQKNAISHRGQASQKMWEHLVALYSDAR